MSILDLQTLPVSARFPTRGPGSAISGGICTITLSLTICVAPVPAQPPVFEAEPDPKLH